MTPSQIREKLYASTRSLEWRARLRNGWELRATCPLGCQNIPVQDTAGVFHWAKHACQTQSHSLTCHWSERVISGDTVGTTTIDMILARR